MAFHLTDIFYTTKKEWTEIMELLQPLSLNFAVSKIQKEQKIQIHTKMISMTRHKELFNNENTKGSPQSLVYFRKLSLQYPYLMSQLLPITIYKKNTLLTHIVN